MKKRFSYSIIIPLLTRKKERKNERKKREEFFLRVAPFSFFFPAKIVFSVSANYFLSSFSQQLDTKKHLKETQQKRLRTTQQKEQPHSEQHLNKNYFSRTTLLTRTSNGSGV